MKNLAATLATVVCLTGSAALAATVDFQIIKDNSAAARALVDKSKSITVDGGTLNASTDVGNTSKQNISPYGDNTTQYFAVGTQNAGNFPNPATLTVTNGTMDILTLLWGTIDNYNVVEFFKNGNSIGSLSGQQVEAAAGRTNVGAALVRIMPHMSFDTVEFSSLRQNNDNPINAFEFGNVSISQVPVPASLPLLLASIAGFGVLARRRRSGSA